MLFIHSISAGCSCQVSCHLFVCHCPQATGAAICSCQLYRYSWRNSLQHTSCDVIGLVVHSIPITTYYVCTLILFAKDGDRDKYKDKYNLFSLVISCGMEEASKCYYDYLLMICSSPQQKQISIIRPHHKISLPPPAAWVWPKWVSIICSWYQSMWSSNDGMGIRFSLFNTLQTLLYLNYILRVMIPANLFVPRTL